MASQKMPETTLFDVTSACIELFQKCVSTGHAALACLQQHQQHFWAWANHSKVFANRDVNLDAQLELENYKGIKAFLEPLLVVLRENLTLALELALAANSNPALDIQSRLKQPLFGIAGAVERLGRIAVAIIKATDKSLTRRAAIFARRHRDDQFEGHVDLVLNHRFGGDIPSGLRLLLKASFLERHYRILYERNRYQVKQEFSPRPRQRRSEPDTVECRKDTEAPKPPPDRPLSVSQSDGSTLPLTIDVPVFEKTYNRGQDEMLQPDDKSSTSVSEAGDATYLTPPTIAKGETHAKCPICFVSLTAGDLEGRRWRRHIDSCTKPFVCISEDCSQNLVFFENKKLWREHMRRIHTPLWIQYLHNSIQWPCPLKHDFPIEPFDSDKALSEHMQKSHGKTDDARLRNLVSNCSVPQLRQVDICPVCNNTHLGGTNQDRLEIGSDDDDLKDETPEETPANATTSARVRFEVTVDPPQTPRGSMTGMRRSLLSEQSADVKIHRRTENYIGQHLKALAFYFLRWTLTDNTEDQQHNSQEQNPAMSRSSGSVCSFSDPPLLPEWNSIESSVEEMAGLTQRQNPRGLPDGWLHDERLGQIPDYGLTAEDLNRLFPDANRKEADTIWDGLGCYVAFSLAASLFILLEICDRLTDVYYILDCGTDTSKQSAITLKSFLFAVQEQHQRVRSSEVKSVWSQVLEDLFTKSKEVAEQVHSMVLGTLPNSSTFVGGLKKQVLELRARLTFNIELSLVNSVQDYRVNRISASHSPYSEPFTKEVELLARCIWAYEDNVDFSSRVKEVTNTILESDRQTERSHKPSTSLIAEFRSHVENSSRVGKNENGQPAHYVSRSLLENHMNEVKINEIFQSCSPPVIESAGQIRADFFLIFCILVYIGKPHDIAIFIRENRNDHHLPLQEISPSWLPELQDFLDKQWMFCPVDFKKGSIYKREVPKKSILPIKYGERLRGDDSDPNAVQIVKVQIDPEYNNLDDEAGTQDYPVVFKIYNDEGSKQTYEDESDIYSALSRYPDFSESITRFYGSLSFDGTQQRIMILEFAPGGSLEDFFDNTDIPVTPTEYGLLWSRLFRLFDGLHLIHNLWVPEGQSIPSFVGVHQDIKPANILVFPQPGRSRFDVLFKWADFGMAEMRRVTSDKPDVQIEKEGNRMYSAPECYINYVVQKRAKARIPTSVDTWSLGAVFSDVLAWSIAGKAGRDEYRSARKTEIRSLTHLRSHEYDACFHDGTKRLSSVDEQHRLFLQSKRMDDEISPRISGCILSLMLTDGIKRGYPLMIRAHLDEHLHEARKHASFPSSVPSRRQTMPRKLAPEPSSSNPTPGVIPAGRRTFMQFAPDGRRTDSLVRGASLAPGPTPGTSRTLSISRQASSQTEEQGRSATYVSVDQIYEILTSNKRWSWQSKRVEVMGLPGIADAVGKIKASGRSRDQIMLIDNMGSMEPHMPQVKRAARVITYVTKATHENGVDVRIASSMDKKLNYKDSSGIEATIEKTNIVAGGCTMGLCIGNILAGVLRRAMNPTSIYIYTDGVWEPGEEDKVESEIYRAIDFLAKHELPPARLMLQFIRFGDDREGVRRLQHLDYNCWKRINGEKYDIVDTKHCDANVSSIVIGSLSNHNDNQITAAPS